MRDRLIELLYEAEGQVNNDIPSVEQIADYLLANGVNVQREGVWKQTEEPMGWHDVDCVECSVCGESWVLDDNLDFDLIVEYWHYCPNCGASMTRGKTNE
jgi:hypothetical protein